MLVVYCHGFQATSDDMEVVKRGMKNILPVAFHLISTANEFDTENDIDYMGLKLAKEIR
jgi:hypothetical protein